VPEEVNEVADEGLGSHQAPRDPEELEAIAGGRAPEISPLTRVGAVHLTVANLERALRYYGTAVGLEALARTDGRASLGVDGRELLVLVEEPGARPGARYTGLYHFALLLPQRVHLARWLAHAVRDRVTLTGLSDHFVSEAIYLTDPDGHGIEIYWDRPRETWQGRVAARMTTLPLDAQALLGELDGRGDDVFDGLPVGTLMGHVHLKVAAIPDTIRFYRDVLGFGLMAQLGGQAAFLSAGGYHHHVGANTWESARAPAPPPGVAALRHATIVVPSGDERERLVRRAQDAGAPAEETAAGPLLSDPAGNKLLLTVGSESAP
jgi:catechol 2,3-dioxygenase